jgi:aryl-alcohol dehydrogenase-like predicted oxidoreductase
MTSNFIPSRLVLGTVQFGSNYGIANRSGQVATEEARRVLQLARANGVDTLDTAIEYGNAEARLGELGVADFKIVTKMPALSSAEDDVYSWLRTRVEESMQRLRAKRLYGLLLHHAPDLFSTAADRLVKALGRVRDAGLVEHIGVSIYAPSDLELVDATGSFGLVQAPMNVFDRRIVSSGLLARLQGAGVEVHLRSAFLQGLLLMPATAVPTIFAPWEPRFERWHAWCRENALTPLQACLAHVQSAAPRAKIVVGCDNAEQFAEILDAVRQPPLEAPDEFRSGDVRLINPALWGRT